MSQEDVEALAKWATETPEGRAAMAEPPPETLAAEELASLKRHKPCECTDHDNAYCLQCNEVWPCLQGKIAARIVALEAALRYYAEPRNYEQYVEHRMQGNDAYDDLKLPGTRARAVLAGEAREKEATDADG